jgi:hypothetical protein
MAGPLVPNVVHELARGEGSAALGLALQPPAGSVHMMEAVVPPNREKAVCKADPKPLTPLASQRRKFAGFSKRAS